MTRAFDCTSKHIMYTVIICLLPLGLKYNNNHGLDSLLIKKVWSMDESYMKGNLELLEMDLVIEYTDL
jgi:hypothetical protein